MQLNPAARGKESVVPDVPATGLAQAPSVESITQLVHAFYADVQRDPLLGPVFEKALHGQWDAHLVRLVEFWCSVMLGTHGFRGNVYQKHMALDGVTPAHFTAWVGLWQLHTRAVFSPEVAQEFQRTAHGIARNLFRGYFDRDPAFAAPREP
jgi:hemoglobin